MFDNVAVEMNGRTRKADYLISDTRMQIRLPAPLKPHTKLRLHIAYHFTIPGKFGGRTGWGRHQERRDLRHGAVVSAHGRL